MSTAFKTLAEEILNLITFFQPIPDDESGFIEVKIYININHRTGELITKDRARCRTTKGRLFCGLSTNLGYYLKEHEFEETKKKLEDDGFYSNKRENCEGSEIVYTFIKPFGFKQ